MKKFKKSIIISVIILTISANYSMSQIQNSGEAIKIVEFQMLLTQRAAKDYFIIGINCCESTTAKAEQELKETTAEFEKNQKDLAKYINSNKEGLKSGIQNISMFWQLYKDILNSSPDIYSASSLMDINYDLNKEHYSIIDVLKENSTEYQEKNIIKICRRQGILSQQIAMLYIGNIWGVNGEKNIKKEYSKSRGEFKKSLKTISLNEENTEDINNNIQTAKNLFAYDDKEFDLSDNYVADIFEITNQLNQKMEDITEMYEEVYSN